MFQGFNHNADTLNLPEHISNMIEQVWSLQKNWHVGAQVDTWGDSNDQISNQGDEKPYSGYNMSIFMKFETFWKKSTLSTP